MRLVGGHMDTNHRYLLNPNIDAIRAIWCIDSETSEELLINLKTSEIIAKRVDGKIIDPGIKSC